MSAHRTAATALTLAVLGACGPSAARGTAPTSALSPATASTPATGTAATAATTATTAAATTATTATTAPATATAARRWIELAEEIVRQDRPGPPTSARLYAYVAATYADARRATATSATTAASGAEASEATRQVLRALAPAHAERIDAVARELGAVASPAPATAAAIASYLARLATDGWAPDDPDAALVGAPQGTGHWVRVGGVGPLNATAGTWTRWLVPAGTTFTVPDPPAYGTPGYAEQQRIVTAAVARRDAHWQQVIERWGGAPGTQAPAGIWLDRLWTETRATPLGTDDARLADAQSALARTVADAFMECWKVKFTWWTARPSMNDPALTLAMANPAFPGYVSGHSTVSAAAAAVLSWLVPDRHDTWWRDAAEARDSRLVAGIHYEVDNTAGFQLGTDVGAAAVSELSRGR